MNEEHIAPDTAQSTVDAAATPEVAIPDPPTEEQTPAPANEIHEMLEPPAAETEAFIRESQPEAPSSGEGEPPAEAGEPLASPEGPEGTTRPTAPRADAGEATAGRDEGLQEAADTGEAAAEVTEERTAEKPARRKKQRPPKTSLRELEPGAEMVGRVVGIAEFGAFVDIGAETDGLVHISELSEGRVGKVSDVVSIGDEVKVWIKDVDTEQGRISLSMRPKPRYRLRDLKRGLVVDGIVTGVRDYGIFVDIGAETEGLVHVSEMADDFVSKPSEMISPGEEIQVRVKKVDRKRRRISLSMKGLRPKAAPPPPPPAREEPMPTAIELALRQALGALEEEIQDVDENLPSPEETSRDELGEVFTRMLREYREQQSREA